VNRALIRRMPLPLRAAAQIVWPTGEHRARRLPGQVTVPEFRHCLPCGVDTAAVVHADGSHTCTEGHTTTGDNR
jgi:hypothetical protein